MKWNRRYLLGSYIRASLWLVPFFAMLLFWVAARVVHGIDLWLLQTGRIDPTIAFYAANTTGAGSALETVITLNMSFLVFTFGSLLVAIQVAGGQYTPRIIATTLLRDNAIRFTVGYFVLTLLFAVRARFIVQGEAVPQFLLFVAIVLGMVSIVIFLFLIDYAARMLRPISIVRSVGMSGLAVIESVYPKSAARSRSNTSSRRPASPDRTVTHAGDSGVVLAVDLAGLALQASRANGIIEFVPQVGDFVAVDEPLFRLYGGAGAIDDRTLRGAVALGTERTMEQDPTFAFRILVDIAIKALSAAINDPTTAVTAIDQLHRLLRMVGLRNLRGDEIRDAAGELRLVFRTPNWEDYVHLTCIEIRQYGAGSVQVMRRMRSMLETLMQILPGHRHAELRLQLDLLDRTIETHYTSPEDRAIARVSDPQGLGGSIGVRAAADGVANSAGAKE